MLFNGAFFLCLSGLGLIPFNLSFINNNAMIAITFPVKSLVFLNYLHMYWQTERNHFFRGDCSQSI